jgi:SPP1 gp7 family putative phage head morphogenesis protein
MKLSRVFRNLSATIRKDPSLMNRLIVRFETALVARGFESLASSIKALLDKTRRLQEPVLFLSVDEFDKQLKETMDREVVLKTRDEVAKMIEQAARSGGIRAGDFLKTSGLVGVVGIPTDELAIKVLVDRAGSKITGMTDEMRKKIVDVVSDGMLKGKSPEDIAKMIDEEVDSGKDRARMIARTESMYAFNTAAKLQYEKFNVQKVRWLTAYDDRTCAECASLDGKEFDIDEVPDCPAHPNCRCVLLPVIEEVG